MILTTTEIRAIQTAYHRFLREDVQPPVLTEPTEAKRRVIKAILDRGLCDDMRAMFKELDGVVYIIPVYFKHLLPSLLEELAA